MELLNEKIDIDQKIKLLTYSKDIISIQNKTYPDKVKKHVLNNNLDTSDFPYLLQNYPNECDEVKDTIRNIVISNFEIILTLKYQIEPELLSVLFNTEKIPPESKNKLLILCLPVANEDDAKNYLQSMNLHDYLSLFDGKHLKFDKNTENEKLLKIFQRRGWISKFDIEDTANYCVYGRKKDEEKIIVS